MRVEGLRSAVAVLIAGAGVGLAVGSANAETAAVAELEASESVDSGIREPTPPAPDAERRGKQREQRKLREQRREEWWANAHAVLFSDIQLSAEQSRGVDAIIETQLGGPRRNPHECMEEMRALLSEEQRPTFDMNRARLAAEGQERGKGRQRKRTGVWRQ